MYFEFMTNTNLVYIYGFFLFFSSYLKAQEVNPPLDIPLSLSGNFGEFRNTHFHLGLDIKTQGKQGLPIKSILAGSIRRIRVATTGYGKVLYIDHPNGLTSVYAHLQKFAPKIEQIIKAYQYKEKKYIVQKYFELGEITVDKGEVIGYSGNTGKSFGPHLHFEVRDTKTLTPLNPLSLNLDIQDSQRPFVQSLYSYDIFPSNISKPNKIPLIKKNDSVYTTPILNWSGRKGIGVQMFDRQDLSYNKNGVYSILIRLNGEEIIGYTFDEIKFKDGDYIDTLIDYKTYELEGFRIQKLFRNLPFDFSFLPKKYPNGIMEFYPGNSYQIQIILADYHGNKTYIESYVKGTVIPENIEKTLKKPTPLLSQELTLLNPNVEHYFELDKQKIYLPKNTFFEPMNFSVKANADTLIITPLGYTLRNPFKISFDAPLPIDSIDPYPWSIARINKKQKLEYVYSEYNEGVLTTTEGTPGTYLLVKDTLSPKITPINFKPKQWLSHYSNLKIKIEDDFSGIKKYKGTINNQWILLEHEPKNNTLTYNFNDIKFNQSKLDFRLEVEDMQGNINVYETTIFRKKSQKATPH